jgi:hypothetical protein
MVGLVVDEMEVDNETEAELGELVRCPDERLMKVRNFSFSAKALGLPRETSGFIHVLWEPRHF